MIRSSRLRVPLACLTFCILVLPITSVSAGDSLNGTSSRTAEDTPGAPKRQLVSVLDCLVVASALLATLAVGLIVARRNTGSAEDYFVGSRAMSWQVVGASMFASNIGTEHFIGQAGSAAAGGLAVGLYEWLSVYLLLTLAFFFAPLYLRLGLTTITQYAEDRFGRNLRMVLTLICLAAYVLTKISATLFTGVILVEVLYGGEVNVYAVAIVLVLITATYTVAGGLKAVMITDALQMAIFLVGGVAGLFVALDKVGFTEMHEVLPSYFFHVVRGSGDYTWHAMFLGQPIGSAWYWCIDQFIVQRVLAAKDLRHAQKGCLFAATMKFLPPMLLCIPGMVARALYERCHLNGHGIEDPWCATNLNDAEAANKAYPLLVVHEFPDGLRGLIITAMFMAMLSSLSSVYNSAATLITVDLFQGRIKPQASERELVLCGRAASVLMTGLTFLWFPVMTSQHGLLYLFVQSLSAHIFPTLVVVYLLGMLTTTVSEPGALIGVAFGAFLGIVQMALALFDDPDHCQKPFFKWECMNFNHFAIALFGSVSIVCMVASLFFAPPTAEQLEGRTVWATPAGKAAKKYADFQDEEETQEYGDDALRKTADEKHPPAGVAPVPAVVGAPIAEIGARPQIEVVLSTASTVAHCPAASEADMCVEARREEISLCAPDVGIFGAALFILMTLNLIYWA
mmetsp:Transcript_44590/g.105714  ORF Transcript_44590/g.105714 Transcript_44590/m.105714 type:complete len:682 (+) Transcript_44590:131-2176(+)